MNNHPLVMAYIEAQPWAITQEGLEIIVRTATRTNELTPEVLQKIQGAKMENAQAYVRDGVAIVPIHGPIFNKANLFTECSGAVSTEKLAKDFNTMLEDEMVQAIILEIDSPGGVAAQIAEMSEMIHDARKRKPIYAYVSHMAASAAYWLASASKSIVLSPTAAVGSIGAILQVQKGKDDELVTFTSKQSPYKNPSPTSKEGKSQLQAYVDSLAQVFVEDVARNRGVTVDKVLSDFKQGGLAFAGDAVKLGMADKVMSFEKFFTGLTKTLASQESPSVFLGLDEPEPIVLAPTGEPEMSDIQSQPTPAQAQPAVAGVSQEALDSLLKAQKASFQVALFENELNLKAASGALLPAQVEQLKATAKTMLEAAPTDETMTSLRALADSFKSTNLLNEQLVTDNKPTAATNKPEAITADDIPDGECGDAFIMNKMANALVAKEGITYKEACYRVEKSQEFKDAVAAL